MQENAEVKKQGRRKWSGRLVMAGSVEEKSDGRDEVTFI